MDVWTKPELVKRKNLFRDKAAKLEAENKQLKLKIKELQNETLNNSNSVNSNSGNSSG